MKSVRVWELGTRPDRRARLDANRRMIEQVTLARRWRGIGAERIVARDRFRAVGAVPELKQAIRFCTSRDGTRIAYATMGRGPPLIRAAHFLTHLEFEPRTPVWRPWLVEYTRDHTLVRYDQRGCGLSDRDVTDFSIDATVDDLEAVVDAAGLERFPLFGASQGSAVVVLVEKLVPGPWVARVSGLALIAWGAAPLVR